MDPRAYKWPDLHDVSHSYATAGRVLASGAVLLPGVVLLLVGLLQGIGASGCTSADQLAGWPWRG